MKLNETNGIYWIGFPHHLNSLCCLVQFGSYKTPSALNKTSIWTSLFVQSKHNTKCIGYRDAVCSWPLHFCSSWFFLFLFQLAKRGAEYVSTFDNGIEKGEDESEYEYCRFVHLKLSEFNSVLFPQFSDDSFHSRWVKRRTEQKHTRNQNSSSFFSSLLK